MNPVTNPVSAQPRSVATASHPTPKSPKLSSWSFSPVVRVIGEAAFGILGNGIVVGSLYSTFPWFDKELRECDPDWEDDCDFFADTIHSYFWVTAVPAALLVPGGVSLFGLIAGQKGSFLYTFLGHTAGMAVGFGSGFILTELFYKYRLRESSGFPIGLMVVATITQVTGAVLGYELSLSGERADENETETKPHADLKLTPIASLTPQGALIGLTGIF